MWASSKRSCNQSNSLLANICAHNVPEKTKDERTNFIKWSLKNDEHVKNIEEASKEEIYG